MNFALMTPQFLNYDDVSRINFHNAQIFTFAVVHYPRLLIRLLSEWLREVQLSH